ncbi:MAG: hypothetical protein AB4062_10290 [Crocosphaera sp.]
MSNPDSNNLMSLATHYNTDKWKSHAYAQHYQKHFEPLRFEKLNILEIGIGGYDDPNSGGASLKMWRDFFPNSMIYGIDIYDKSGLEEERIKVFQGNQNDPVFLKDCVHKVGGFNIVIDDGCHINSHVITSFKTLFPSLRDEGIYVVEDTQTSYWKKYGGNSEDLNSLITTMGFLKSLIDCLNYEEFDRPGYVPSEFDKNLIEIHFYHNLVFLYKGENNEGSNIVENNVLPESHPLIILD